tara:strand:+ start:20475 stop:22310 length:1836 start_codon:yes stop_codon:yes gene_type:complete
MKSAYRTILGTLVSTMLLLACNSAQIKSTAPEAPVTEPATIELGGGGRPIGAPYSRSTVYASNGMAATAQPLASQVAVDILQAGGSAVDAAIAANAALGLMEPTGCGIGGDIFVMIWDPKSRKLYGYNGSGRSPAGRSLEQLQAQIAALKAEGKLSQDYAGIPSTGYLPVTVPGTVDGWFAIHDRFGKLPMAKVLAPAVRYANEGFPVSPVIAYYLERNRLAFDRLLTGSDLLEGIYSTWYPGGAAPAAGDVFRNPDLGATLAAIGAGGREVFYQGDLARRMDGYFRQMGADLTFADFSSHRGEWVEPVGVEYRGYELYELPPNGQGVAALQMLNILKQVDLSQWPRGSAEAFHYMVEAKRLAFEDVARYYADPDFANIPLTGLVSEEYGQARFALIDPDHAATDFAPGDPKIEGAGDTTYLTVADKSGMMVSLIQSNYRGMGSGLVPDGMGFMLQDRGELFSLDPKHPNAYAPGKRPFHTIIPAFLMKGGEPMMSFGLMGGSMQPQGHVQIVVNIIDYGMDIQQAGDAARFMHDGGRQPTGIHGDSLGVLYVEPGVSAETIKRLRTLGHQVEIDETGVSFGGYQAIARDPATGVYSGATEMRKDGTVAAW